jgi:hypothetical protein
MGYFRYVVFGNDSDHRHLPRPASGLAWGTLTRRKSRPNIGVEALRETAANKILALAESNGLVARSSPDEPDHLRYGVLRRD